ncbi:hypothetical protein Y695_04700 [Hydrogenophaga sp. T4]|nr:hypothetical protein Y695_04700 [Hydrogenophaga sp. T4]
MMAASLSSNWLPNLPRRSRLTSRTASQTMARNSSEATATLTPTSQEKFSS